MDIVVEPVQQAPDEEVYSGTGRDTEPPAAEATQEEDAVQDAPPPKQRGRPPGSKNKPTVVETETIQEVPDNLEPAPLPPDIPI